MSRRRASSDSLYSMYSQTRGAGCPHRLTHQHRVYSAGLAGNTKAPVPASRSSRGPCCRRLLRSDFLAGRLPLNAECRAWQNSRGDSQGASPVTPT